ncbi:hypothetical protein CASFOL_034945 [Castilleja foliolosa]|uniref:Uncharacterized protein n=1 Tax=Castilleja foliolosa TaxID=1961234 RepID=A0ABD3BRG6_9LAMI
MGLPDIASPNPNRAQWKDRRSFNNYTQTCHSFGEDSENNNHLKLISKGDLRWKRKDWGNKDTNLNLCP